MSEMDVLEEIRRGLANLDNSGRMLPITALQLDAPAWVFRDGEVFGVAVELPDGPQVAEGFAGARMVTVDRVVGGTVCRLLRLESSIEGLRNEFAVVCAQMVTPGPGGATRISLLANPSGWWDRWRHLLGNAVVNRTTYATLAEMLAIERLLSRGEKIEWRGPLGGAIDIATPSAGYEVKATVSRYDSRIHVSGQFQLALAEGRPLNLLHYRFEPAESGECVNAVCRRLIAAGMSTELLEGLLSRCGLEAGCSAREETFILLESRIFPVNAAFPRITPASFVGGTVPSGVVHVEYQVDLSGLVNEAF
jgi:hypothetical protein